MTRIAVIDHGAGNLVSIAQGLRRAGAEVTVAASPAEIDGADGLVLPGVGTTGAAMERLEEAGFVEPLRRWDRPLLGICVGLQLFFDASDEDGSHALGLIPGAVRRLEGAPLLPHIGWNDVSLRDDPLFAGIPSGSTFYFVHSFAPVPDDPGAVIGESVYGKPFVAAARSGTRVGVQFHPERSGDAGLRVLANFVATTGGAGDAA
ncbi:MAG: imidazole glycerol phosphate synthase subunit HisH [Acidimicrobiia bacterium]